MFVAAAPTAGEEASAAAAGSEQLATYLRLLDLDPRPGVSLYTTAAVKCLPRSAEGARAPTTGECDACWPFLSRELSTITPHVLVPAGATAAAVLLPRLLGTAAPELDPLHLQVVTTPAFRVVPIPSPEEIAALAPRPRKICLEQLRSLATRLGF
jgi:uracil-DNA glycosylase family 4